MSFSLDTTHTKYLHNYAAALAHHDNVKPIRNSNCRPMAERRKQHFNIRKATNALSEQTSIIVRLYSTDIVTYTPDNRIILHMGRHNTISTRAAIEAVTGVSITQQHGCSWVRDHDGKHYLFKDDMELETVGYRENKVLDPIYPEVHKLNRKAMNQKLHQFKNFYNYLLGVAKVDGWRGQSPGMDSLFRYTMTNPDNYRDGLFTLEPEAAYALSRHIMTNHYISGRDSYWRFFQPMSRHDTTPTFNLEHAISTALKRALIITFRDTLLTKTTVTDGHITKDPYKWAL
jgi:hypothetical protein